MTLKLRDPLAVKVNGVKRLPFESNIAGKTTKCVIMVLAPNGGVTPVYLIKDSENERDGNDYFINTDWIAAYKDKHMANDYPESMIDLVVDRLRERMVHRGVNSNNPGKGGRFGLRTDDVGTAFVTAIPHYGVAAPDHGPYDPLYGDGSFIDAAARSLKACLAPAWEDAQTAAQEMVDAGEDFNWARALSDSAGSRVKSAIAAKVDFIDTTRYNSPYGFASLGDVAFRGMFPHVAFNVPGGVDVDTSTKPDMMKDPKASLDDVVGWNGWDYRRVNGGIATWDVESWNSEQMDTFKGLISKFQNVLNFTDDMDDKQEESICGVSYFMAAQAAPVFLSGMISGLDFDNIREPDGESEKIVSGDPDVTYLVADYRRSYVDYRFVEYVTNETKQRLSDPDTTSELDALMSDFADIRTLVTAHARVKDGFIPANYNWENTDLYKVAKDGEKLEELESTVFSEMTKEDGTKERTTIKEAVNRVGKLEGKQTDFVMIVGGSSAPNMWREYVSGERVWREWDSANESHSYHSSEKGVVSGDELLYLITRGAQYDGNKGDTGGETHLQEDLPVTPSTMETEYGGELSRGWNRMDDRHFLLRDETELTDDEIMRFLMITKGTNRSRFMALHVASQAQFLATTEEAQAS